jgi:hypothetical protein
MGFANKGEGEVEGDTEGVPEYDDKDGLEDGDDGEAKEETSATAPTTQTTTAPIWATNKKGRYNTLTHKPCSKNQGFHAPIGFFDIKPGTNPPELYASCRKHAEVHIPTF